MEDIQENWKMLDLGNEKEVKIAIVIDDPKILNGDQICGISPGNSSSKHISRDSHLAHAKLIAAAPRTKRERDACLVVLNAITKMPCISALLEEPTNDGCASCLANEVIKAINGEVK